MAPRCSRTALSDVTLETPRGGDRVQIGPISATAVLIRCKTRCSLECPSVDKTPRCSKRCFTECTSGQRAVAVAASRGSGMVVAILAMIVSATMHVGSATAVAAIRRNCTSRFTVPQAPPQHATEYNGWALPDVCFEDPGAHHIFVIGDWGGISSPAGVAPVPADHRSKTHFNAHSRSYVHGADNCAQQNVAAQMSHRAPVSRPDFIINVGDNFYWGGIKSACGAPADAQPDTGQWGPIFENIYTGDGIDGKQWLGVLGNHDYGGYTFTRAWDQNIYYTWGGNPAYWKNRWMTPALYWNVKVWYADFSVDFYFIDSNVFDSWEPHLNQGHNICGLAHNSGPVSCGAQGPTTVWNCPTWFSDLWDKQLLWLDDLLNKTEADWQVVVTHFPPTNGQEDWKRLSLAYGIDLMICGHKHLQEVHYMEAGNPIRPTAWVISGGGGGITSEGQPAEDGNDDMYGFMDLTLTRDVITIEAISHGGQLRSKTNVYPRLPGQRAPEEETTEKHDDAPGPVDKRERRKHRKNIKNQSVGDDAVKHHHGKVEETDEKPHALDGANKSLHRDSEQHSKNRSTTNQPTHVGDGEHEHGHIENMSEAIEKIGKAIEKINQQKQGEGHQTEHDTMSVVKDVTARDIYGGPDDVDETTDASAGAQRADRARSSARHETSDRGNESSQGQVGAEKRDGDEQSDVVLRVLELNDTVPETFLGRSDGQKKNATAANISNTDIGRSNDSGNVSDEWMAKQMALDTSWQQSHLKHEQTMQSSQASHNPTVTDDRWEDEGPGAREQNAWPPRLEAQLENAERGAEAFERQTLKLPIEALRRLFVAMMLIIVFSYCLYCFCSGSGEHSARQPAFCCTDEFSLPERCTVCVIEKPAVAGYPKTGDRNVSNRGSFQTISNVMRLPKLGFKSEPQWSVLSLDEDIDDEVVLHA